jgi:hypothetical protein
VLCRDTNTFPALPTKTCTMGGECFLNCDNDVNYNRVTIQQLTGVMPQNTALTDNAMQCTYTVTSAFTGGTGASCEVKGRAACFLKFT